MLVINGRKVPVQGVIGKSFLDDVNLGFTNKKDSKPRDPKSEVKIIVLHTRLGISAQQIVDHIPANRWNEVVAKRMSGDDRVASWHISIGSDGSFVCHADLVKTHCYHAGQLNDKSVGIEIYQDTEGRITKASLNSCLLIVDTITRELGIQRQFPVESKICKRFASNKRGLTKGSKLAYVEGGLSGSDYNGIVGHRNATRNRGAGDPGDHIFNLLKVHGYESFMVDAEEDRNKWTLRQVDLRITPTGIADQATRLAITTSGRNPRGLWVTRPGD